LTAYGAVIDRIESRFARVEPLRHAGGLMLGLLSTLERKNCWTIAEFLGEVSPDSLQHLLAGARWDAEAVRDDLRGYVVDAFAEQDAILVFDETGDLKKGTGTVGVQRQYTGTAGRIENSQVAVYLTYATRRGHAFLDRALYLPAAWSEDPQRRRDAAVPADVEFATKPALASQMLARAVQAGVPAGWVAGDEVYGADPALRAAIRDHGLGYVLMIACNRQVDTGAGRQRVDQIAAATPARAWQTYSAGAGSKGPRNYDWAWHQLLPEHDNAGHHWLLIRRNAKTGELAYLLCYSPRRVPLPTLIRVAGQRWRVEENFQAAKGLTGLDQHQVRRWTSWHRWSVLAMFAHAFLAVATMIERAHTPAPDGMIELTVNEFRKLFDALVLTGRLNPETRIRWSHWRRRHQARARDSHHRARLDHQ
jgi:SRSO17 transposase